MKLMARAGSLTNVNNVAAAVIARMRRTHGIDRIDTFRLQKLVYYCQAWHLVWEGDALFPQQIEAWSGGPVVRELYEQHRARYAVDRWPTGSSRNLTAQEKTTVNVVVDAYGRLSGRQLSRMTHRETPWRQARADLQPGERGSNVISLDVMADFYGGLDDAAEDDVVAIDEVPEDD
jgi:uncharacterized phage-associated protein